jgi:thioredoxin reductase
VAQRQNVEIPFDHKVTVINGDDVRSIFFGEQLDLDENGYIIINRLGHTSAPKTFAAGDAAISKSPMIATPTGTGATAVKITFSCLVPDRP